MRVHFGFGFVEELGLSLGSCVLGKALVLDSLVAKVVVLLGSHRNSQELLTLESGALLSGLGFLVGVRGS